MTVRAAPLPPIANPPAGTSAASDDTACTVRALTGVSASPTVRFTITGVSSVVVCAAIAATVGASATLVTVSVNARDAVCAPSLTVRVIVADPN